MFVEAKFVVEISAAQVDGFSLELCAKFVFTHRLGGWLGSGPRDRMFVRLRVLRRLRGAIRKHGRWLRNKGKEACPYCTF